MTDALDFAKDYTENAAKRFRTLGLVYGTQFEEAPTARNMQLKKKIEAALNVAASVLHLEDLVQIRLARGIGFMPVLKWHLNQKGSEMMMWLRDHNNDEIVYITFIPCELGKSLNIKEFADEMYFVDREDALKRDGVPGVGTKLASYSSSERHRRK